MPRASTNTNPQLTTPLTKYKKWIKSKWILTFTRQARRSLHRKLQSQKILSTLTTQTRKLLIAFFVFPISINFIDNHFLVTCGYELHLNYPNIAMVYNSIGHCAYEQSSKRYCVIGLSVLKETLLDDIT